MITKGCVNMGKYIFLGIAAIIIIFGPTIAWRIYRAYGYSKSTKEFVSKPFVCPNCGKRDLCGRPYDFDKD